MWIFAKHGFLSIVQLEDKPSMLLVRARVREDLAHYFPGFQISENAGSDYKYRTTVPRQNVADVVQQIAKDIDYTNFKNSAISKDARRTLYYIQVWNAMFEMQEALSPNGKRKRYGNHKTRRKEPKAA